MSKQTPKSQDERQDRADARQEEREDPMTSFQSGRGTDSAQSGQQGSAPHAAPAERAPEGNGSDRTVRTPGQAPPREDPAAQPGAEATPQPGAKPADDGRVQLEAAQKEAAANFDRFVRLQAEFDNYKKRVHKEHSESLRFALSPLVAEVASVMDNLERAVAHARSEQGEAVGALLAGIEMVVKQMQDALGRFGVSRIEAVGKPFDPALHEALVVVERSDVPENQVLEELQAGYLLHDRVVRPARVSVSKRGEEASQETPPAGS